MEFISAITGVIAAILLSVIALNVRTITRVSKNSEAILRRLLELEKESSNERKRAQQLRTGRNEFARYKADM